MKDDGTPLRIVLDSIYETKNVLATPIRMAHKTAVPDTAADQYRRAAVCAPDCESTGPAVDTASCDVILIPW